ncbi:hypothetical protein SY89_03429 [Halolamina pelagica]|uniref:Uncharacterized protein n=1 Tax=Halolamina pelagica TaxID=699431 RepID=A0A0N8HZD4_9EURY|nr:hypothetical protein [Halolamina pelagica]KPN29195.1 hypothetical protein SY89_03429 [Halolamina pelagica]
MQAGTTREPTPDERFPAYGPLEAALGYVLFYVLVDRVTPAVVEVFSGTVLDFSPSFVGFTLAALLWIVLVVTVVDELRRQLAARGIVAGQPRVRGWSRVTPAPLRTLGYLVALAVGAGVAALTFERAVAVIQSLIPAVATVDPGGIDLIGVVVMVVFFVAYSTATHALDRLVIGAVRSLAAL